MNSLRFDLGYVQLVTGTNGCCLVGCTYRDGKSSRLSLELAKGPSVKTAAESHWLANEMKSKKGYKQAQQQQVYSGLSF